jgi:hypothetical protein
MNSRGYSRSDIPMTKNDRKWYDTVISPQQQTDPGNAGRTCHHYLLMAPHPLHSSHILVPRAKIGVPAFAGAAPPTDASSILLGLAAKQKRKRYAAFFVSNFVPWSAAQPPVLSYDVWMNHINTIEHEACLRKDREPEVSRTSQEDKVAIESASRSRLIAAGRLYDNENITSCFKTKQASVVLLGKHRARARTIWNSRNKPYSVAPSSETHRAANAIQKLQDKANRLLWAPNQIRRQKDAAWASQWVDELQCALKRTQPQNTVYRDVSQRLESIWTKAARPTMLSLQGGIRNPNEITSVLKRPIILNDFNEYRMTATMATPTASNPMLTIPNSDANIMDNDPFAEINDAAYDIAAAAHKFSGLPTAHAPLS